MNNDSKIYVAGHNGLVGSAILKNLRAQGYTNFVTRRSAELDLTNQKAVADFFIEEKPKYVFLAAAKVGGIVANNTYRGQFIYENLMIQSNVIHQAYVSGVEKLLFLGSTCIYPKEAPQPMSENCLLTSALEYTNEPYAIAKIAGIKMCESYNLQYGTNFISVMPTNLYGPNDNFDLEKSHVLPALLRKVHLGKCLEESNWVELRRDLNRYPVEGVNGESTEKDILDILAKYGVTISASQAVCVEIWGTGTPRREFLWSEEMADACIYVMENVDFDDIRKNCDKEVRNIHLNIGTGEDISIKDLAFLVKETVKFKGNFIFNAEKPDGTMQKLTDPSAIQELGWMHSIGIEAGIKKIYDWYS